VDKIQVTRLICYLVSKKSIAHRRETSNALNASVHCEQKRLQKLSETVPANNRIPQAVRQGIPDRRSSHTESPSAIEARAGGAVRLAVRWRIGDVAVMRHLRLAQFHEVYGGA